MITLNLRTPVINTLCWENLPDQQMQQSFCQDAEVTFTDGNKNMFHTGAKEITQDEQQPATCV